MQKISFIKVFLIVLLSVVVRCTIVLWMMSRKVSQEAKAFWCIILGHAEPSIRGIDIKKECKGDKVREENKNEEDSATLSSSISTLKHTFHESCRSPTYLYFPNLYRNNTNNRVFDHKKNIHENKTLSKEQRHL